MSFSQLRRVLSVMDANLLCIKSILHYGGILGYNNGGNFNGKVRSGNVREMETNLK